MNERANVSAGFRKNMSMLLSLVGSSTVMLSLEVSKKSNQDQTAVAESEHPLDLDQESVTHQPSTLIFLLASCVSKN